MDEHPWPVTAAAGILVLFLLVLSVPFIIVLGALLLVQQAVVAGPGPVGMGLGALGGALLVGVVLAIRYFWGVDR